MGDALPDPGAVISALGAALRRWRVCRRLGSTATPRRWMDRFRGTRERAWPDAARALRWAPRWCGCRTNSGEAARARSVSARALDPASGTRPCCGGAESRGSHARRVPHGALARGACPCSQDRGTGSSPTPAHGWHLRIRNTASRDPRRNPWISIASFAYSEHDGWKRHLPPMIGDRAT